MAPLGGSGSALKYRLTNRPQQDDPTQDSSHPLIIWRTPSRVRATKFPIPSPNCWALSLDNSSPPPSSEAEVQVMLSQLRCDGRDVVRSSYLLARYVSTALGRVQVEVPGIRSRDVPQSQAGDPSMQ